MKYVMTATVAKVTELIVKQWRGGIGKDAAFTDISEGWSVQLKEWPTAALHLGHDQPALSEGDRVRLTLERLP